jgi:hypothetical protein
MLVEFDLRMFVKDSSIEKVDSILVRPTRRSKDNDGVHRLFWEIQSYTGVVFEEGLKEAAAAAVQLLRPLDVVNEFDPTLWCVVHSENEFFGLALETSLMEFFATNGLCLVISVYTDFPSISAASTPA